jgi:hypothetical protein
MDENKTEPRRELDPVLLLRYERDPALIQKIAANNQQLRADLAVIKQHCDSINAQLDEMIANADRRLANHEAQERERTERRLEKMEHDLFVLRCKTSICIGFMIGLMIVIVQLHLGLFEI